MIRKPVKRSSIVEEFRANRGQKTEHTVNVTMPKKRKSNNSPYDTFLRKYNDLENSIESFGTRDLVYYFRETAERQGFKYVIANIKKDMAIFKRLREQYSNWEICAMIEFLYISNQDYLDKNRLSPNLLASQWVNTIYADSQLWVDDKYVSSKSKSSKKQHEWDNSVVKDNTVIGVKL